MAQHFRAGVVVVVRHPTERLVLAFERADAPGSWQFPQGGIESGETPIEAAWRELREETGLGDAEVSLAEGDAEWIVYEWPPEVRARTHHHPDRLGQVQRWYWFTARSSDIVPQPDGREFAGWRWVDPDWLAGHVVRWRADAYRRGLARWR